MVVNFDAAARRELPPALCIKEDMNQFEALCKLASDEKGGVKIFDG